MKRIIVLGMALLVLPCLTAATPLPDTNLTKCYNNTQEIICPNPGSPFYGQDAQYNYNQQSYTKIDSSGNDLPDNATEWVMVRDNVTGLVWEVKNAMDDIRITTIPTMLIIDIIGMTVLLV